MNELNYNGFASEEQYEAVKNAVADCIGEWAGYYDVQLKEDEGYDAIVVKANGMSIWLDDTMGLYFVELKGGKDFIEGCDLAVLRELDAEYLYRFMYY